MSSCSGGAGQSISNDGWGLLVEMEAGTRKRDLAGPAIYSQQGLAGDPRRVAQRSDQVHDADVVPFAGLVNGRGPLVRRDAPRQSTLNATLWVEERVGLGKPNGFVVRMSKLGVKMPAPEVPPWGPRGLWEGQKGARRANAKENGKCLAAHGSPCSPCSPSAGARLGPIPQEWAVI